MQALEPFGILVLTRVDIHPLVLNDILVMKLVGNPALLEILARVLDDMMVLLDKLVQAQECRDHWVEVVRCTCKQAFGTYFRNLLGRGQVVHTAIESVVRLGLVHIFGRLEEELHMLDTSQVRPAVIDPVKQEEHKLAPGVSGANYLDLVSM